jgi:Leucine-rich repeat (LRR) protein
MNINQARKRIKKAQDTNSWELNLSSFLDNENLSSEDLESLMPEIEKLRNLSTFDLRNNQRISMLWRSSEISHLLI